MEPRQINKLNNLGEDFLAILLGNFDRILIFFFFLEKKEWKKKALYLWNLPGAVDAAPRR